MQNSGGSELKQQKAIWNALYVRFEPTPSIIDSTFEVQHQSH